MKLTFGYARNGSNEICKFKNYINKIVMLKFQAKEILFDSVSNE